MVRFSILLLFWKDWIKPVRSKGNHGNITNIICCCMFCSNTKYIVPYCLNFSDLIEYRYILLKICSGSVLVSAGCNDINPVEFSCGLLTWYGFQNLLSCFWFFYTNYKDPYIGPVLCGKTTVPRSIFLLTGIYIACCYFHSIFQWYQ